MKVRESSPMIRRRTTESKVELRFPSHGKNCRSFVNESLPHLAGGRTVLDLADRSKVLAPGLEVRFSPSGAAARFRGT
jgi:hypothetical protein